MHRIAMNGADSQWRGEAFPRPIAMLSSIVVAAAVVAGCEDEPEREAEPAASREEVLDVAPSEADRVLAKLVEEALDRHEELEDIEAEARDGVVRLSGDVDHAAQRNAAIAGAWSVPRVRRVEDHLSIKNVPDDVLERRVAQALTMEPSTAIEARVQVVGGVVMLRGPVRDAATKQLIQDIAASVDGVRRVIDRTVPRQLHVRVLDEEQTKELRAQLEERRKDKEGTVEEELKLAPVEQRRVPEEVPFGSVLLQLGKGSGRLFVFREPTECEAIPDDLDKAGDALLVTARLQPRDGAWEGHTRTTQVRRWEPLPGAEQDPIEEELSADFVVDRISDERAEGTLHLRSLQPTGGFRLDAEVSAKVCGNPTE